MGRLVICLFALCLMAAQGVASEPKKPGIQKPVFIQFSWLFCDTEKDIEQFVAFHYGDRRVNPKEAIAETNNISGRIVCDVRKLALKKHPRKVRVIETMTHEVWIYEVRTATRSWYACVAKELLVA